MFYVYVACFTFGLLYSVVSSVLGHHGFDHGGADHSGLHGDTADGPSPFNPLVMASAIATFGAVGVIGKAGLKMGDMASAVLALGFAGAIAAVVFYGVVRFVYNSQSDSSFSQNDLVEAEAEIITPIPEAGMGEIAFVINGVRSTLPAKSASGDEIKRGEAVKIKEVKGNIALVTRKITINDICSNEFHLDDYNLPEVEEKAPGRRTENKN